jgi:hypothetical protein
MPGVNKLALIAVVVAACSSSPAPPAAETGRDVTGDGAPVPATAGVPIEVEGPMTGCDPVGLWRARGSFPGTGDCEALPNELVVEVEVARADGGFRIATRGPGQLTGDRLAAARGGGCALGFALRRDDARLFAHLVDGGDGGARGRGAWDRYGAGGALICTDDVVFAVERISPAARSAE